MKATSTLLTTVAMTAALAVMGCEKDSTSSAEKGMKDATTQAEGAAKDAAKKAEEMGKDLTGN